MMRVTGWSFYCNTFWYTLHSTYTVHSYLQSIFILFPHAVDQLRDNCSYCTRGRSVIGWSVFRNFFAYKLQWIIRRIEQSLSKRSDTIFNLFHLSIYLLYSYRLGMNWWAKKGENITAEKMNLHKVVLTEKLQCSMKRLWWSKRCC